MVQRQRYHRGYRELFLRGAFFEKSSGLFLSLQSRLLFSGTPRTQTREGLPPPEVSQDGGGSLNCPSTAPLSPGCQRTRLALLEIGGSGRWSPPRCCSPSTPGVQGENLGGRSSPPYGPERGPPAGSRAGSGWAPGHHLWRPQLQQGIHLAPPAQGWGSHSGAGVQAWLGPQHCPLVGRWVCWVSDWE